MASSFKRLMEDSREISRRSFLAITGWVGFTAASAIALYQSLKFVYPNATYEDPPAFKADAPGTYAVGSTTVLIDKRVVINHDPDGFYANLAKVQLKKIAAEETRVTASEKARQAEQEKARLAAEGARQAEQAKAAAAAKVAEEARIAAERAKQIEQEKAAAAERARLAEQEKVRLAAEEKAKQAGQEKAAAAEQARLAAEKTASEKQQLAAVSPADKPEQPVIDLPRALQAELRRVGCNTGAVDGTWNAAAQRSLELFNKHSGMKLDVKLASVDALDAVKNKSSRICPLICGHGFRVDGEQCVRITCRVGFRVNEDNECEKIPEKPVAKREISAPKRDAERKQTEAASAKPQASGQIFCDSQGCRQTRKGCRIEMNRPGISGAQGSGGLIETCN